MMTKEKNPREKANELLFTWLCRCGWVLRCNSAMRDRRLVLQSLSSLEKLTRLLEAEFSFELPRVAKDWDVKSLKQFCDGLISGEAHEWRTSLLTKHACQRTRVGIASSLFLFRKAIRQERLSRKELEKKNEDYIERMCIPQAPPGQDVLNFATKLLAREFRPGWDRGWYSAVDNFCLPTKSTKERKLKDGGGRGLLGEYEVWRGQSQIDELRARYLDFIDGSGLDLDNRTRVSTIFTGGKNRTVSVFSVERSFLTPLHKTIYNHCATRHWLLRGEAKPDAFTDFERREGEIFVSGDYESASDNLNIHLSEHILGCLARTSLHIPPWVFKQGLLALRAQFDGGREQARGQLMGSLLSFPLLCITNYIALKFSIRRKIPVKINGDDIVFRCRPEEHHRWLRTVELFGLRLSIGKTLVAKSVFSLNSTFLKATSKMPTQLPFFRSSCIFGKAETCHAIPGRLESCVVGVRKQTKEKVQTLVLNECKQAVWGSERSLRRGLRCRISSRPILDSNLKDRERFYMSIPEEKNLPPIWPGTKKCIFLEGWTQIESSHNPGFQQAFFDELIEQAWKPMESVEEDDYWERVREGGYRYQPMPNVKFALAAGMTRIEYDNLFSRPLPPFKPTIKEKFWVRTGCKSRRTLRFASAGFE